MSFSRLTVILFLLLGFAVSAGAETRIFDLQYRKASELAETVRTVLDEDARVTAIDRSLIVNARPEQLELAAELLARMDKPPRMLRVFVNQVQSQVLSSGQASVAGRASVGDATVVIGGADKRPHDGSSVIVGHGDDHVRLDARQSSVREARNFEQFIVTLEGSPARISIGRRIPFTERWLQLARRHAKIVDSVRYESVDTGFEVQPELAGSVVQLDIRPFMAFQDTRHPQEIRFQELTTSVHVTLGEWFDLGGSMADRDEVSREILGTGSGSSVEGGSVRVRVELQQD